ncbi:TolC family protein [Tahibacter aquaticus]|uniref:TolC family protein n=1 Tax=Tahibacter aquaticus TaxID=520092 RepID=UPI001414E2D8|nr:TolC family protein [Tahibacter aquaticus]
MFAVLALAALWAARAADAAPPPDVGAETPLTLQETLRRVAEQGPQSALADATLRSAEANVGVARQLPNPTLSVEAENIGGTGAYSGGQLRETTTSLAWPLELGGKRAARVRAAEAERTAAVLGADAARADAVLQATEIFIEAAAGERRLVLARERLRLAETGVNAARARVRAGKASPIDEQRAEVVRLNAEVAVGQAQRTVDLARATFARWTGTPGAVPRAAWFETVEGDVSPETDTPPALALAEAEVAAADARLSVARRARIPDLTLSAGVRRFAAVDDRATVVGIALPFPVFSSGRAGVAKARADLDASEARQRTIALDYGRAAASAQAELDNARAAAQTAGGPALAAAEEAARIARLGYEAGKFSQLDLLEAERVLAETRGGAVQALTDFHLARARLIRLQGRADPLFKD